MKTIRFAVLLMTLVTGSLFVPSAKAQQHQTIRVTVPFDFTVGKNVLPAGQYLISTMEGSLIQLRNEKTDKITSAIAPREVNDSDKDGVLVFASRDGQHALTDIFDDAMNVHIPGAKAHSRNRNQQRAGLIFIPIK